MLTLRHSAWRVGKATLGLTPAVPIQTRQIFLLCIAGAVLLYIGIRRMIAHLRSRMFGEREGVDAVESFGVIDSFDVATLVGHKQDIECLAVCGTGPNDGLIVSACLGGQIRVWNQQSRRYPAPAYVRYPFLPGMTS